MSAKSPCASAHIPSSVCNVWEIHAPCENTYKSVSDPHGTPNRSTLRLLTSDFLPVCTGLSSAATEFSLRTIASHRCASSSNQRFSIAEAAAHASRSKPDALPGPAGRRTHARWMLRHAPSSEQMTSRPSKAIDDDQHTVHAMRRPSMNLLSEFRRGECRDLVPADDAGTRGGR